MHKESVCYNEQHGDHIRKRENTCDIITTWCVDGPHEWEVSNKGTAFIYCIRN